MKKLIFTIVLVCFVFAGFAQGTLQFSQVLLVGPTPQTVPAGKVWKVENVIYETGTYLKASSGSGQCGSPCNGSTQIWTSYSNQTCAFTSTTQITVNGVACAIGNTGSPLWLPAGTNLSGSTKTCVDAGYFGGCGTCPAPTVINAYVSVIEFNVLP